MLEMFERHLAFVQNAWGKWGSCTPGWAEAMKPEKLAKILVFSFLEDIREALLSSVYTYPPVELCNVGILQRVGGGMIEFSAHPLLHREAGKRQLLLDGLFWKVLSDGDGLVPSPIAPVSFPKHTSTPLRTVCLQEVAERMLEVLQSLDRLFSHISLEALRNGLCICIHDAICCGAGIYIKGIGTFFYPGYFGVDPVLRERIRKQEEHIQKKEQFFYIPSASRRKTKNQAWY
jgi:hypothetical protein